MRYSEIAVYTASSSSDLVAFFLQEVCLDGISIYDKNDLYNNSSWDYKDDVADKPYDENEVIVKGYCNLEDTDQALKYLRESFAGLTDAGSLKIVVGTVEGDASVAKFKETFKPIETDKLVICPEWESVTTDKLTLLLDTGVAFGTGQHETTSMCLQFAEQLNLVNKRVLDVGCGSGILGLSAILLGADFAELVDIDKQATDIAAHNSQINGLLNKCAIKTGHLTEQTSGKFDVVFANLTADILAMLHDDISAVIHKNTVVVLSGILDIKLQYVADMYSDLFEIVQTKSMGEWRALLLKVK